MEKDLLLSVLVNELAKHDILEEQCIDDLEAAIELSMDEIAFSLTRIFFNAGLKNQVQNNFKVLEILGMALIEFSTQGAQSKTIMPQKLFYQWITSKS
jgi:hypothetical protein